MLPLIAAAAVPAALGAAGNILGTMTNNQLQRRNKAKLEDLLNLEDQGALGLSPVEQRRMTQALVSPVQQAAALGRQRAEQLAAANPGASAGDLAQLRKEEVGARAQGAMAAGAQIEDANSAKVAQQKAEIEQRMQAKARMRADDMTGILQGATEAAGAAGAALGAPPGAVPGMGQGQAALAAGLKQVGGVAPPPLAAVAPGAFSAQELSQLETFRRSNPGGWQALLASLAAGG